MKHLKYLEAKRLFKELEFVESDYAYQSEVIQSANDLFFKQVDILLDGFPDMKKQYDEKSIVDTVDYVFVEELELDEVSVIESIVKDPEIKSMFRKVVKNTHPDKISSVKLNNLYLKANEAYEDNNMPLMLQVCSDLEIDIDYDKYFSIINESINMYKNKINFIKKTYTYKWIKSGNKEEVLLDFIKNNIK